ncbi:hypothetical protein GPECTOR_15g438 [Gonium pectorale]|uniref:Uncharacterized protein n=1 Tax=Gonium pectorale TaxID=33097 RepID=A0A150GLN9_GONPE|nr:hypothetical protein GPECTOR_15g438 [Gonium pectorale]|eukprot:KXZ50753.1 hypothetical protein GPECTOR_15g438 [Gonium pectorale]
MNPTLQGPTRHCPAIARTPDVHESQLIQECKPAPGADDDAAAAIATHLCDHGTLCGAPLPPGTNLAWLRKKVLKPFKLPDLTELAFRFELVPCGGLKQLMGVHEQAAVELAFSTIKADLPPSLLLRLQVVAYAVVPDGEAPGLAVHRVISYSPVSMSYGVFHQLKGWSCAWKPDSSPSVRDKSVQSDMPVTWNGLHPRVQQALPEAIKSRLDGVEAVWWNTARPSPWVNSPVISKALPQPVLLIRAMT